jgi:UDP-N-acetylmuramyl pentapeptide phosphotransferase/UDP-N-acetylglucosamine-1-phosphate transferase
MTIGAFALTAGADGLAAATVLVSLLFIALMPKAVPMPTTATTVTAATAGFFNA